MIPDLEQMLDAAGRHARTVLIDRNEDLMPIFHLCDAEGHGYIVATPFQGDSQEEVDACKDGVAEAVRELIAEKGIVRYSFFSEAWMVVRPAYFPGVSERPAQADDRIEVVIAFATDGAKYRHRRWRIRRDGAKCVDLVLDTPLGDEERPTGQGRFEGLLKPVTH